MQSGKLLRNNISLGLVLSSSPYSVYTVNVTLAKRSNLSSCFPVCKDCKDCHSRQIRLCGPFGFRLSVAMIPKLIPLVR